MISLKSWFRRGPEVSQPDVQPTSSGRRSSRSRRSFAENHRRRGHLRRWARFCRSAGLVALLLIAGHFVCRSIERTLLNNVESQLQTVLNLEVSALRHWLQIRTASAEAIVRDARWKPVFAQILPSRPAESADGDRVTVFDRQTSEFAGRVLTSLPGSDSVTGYFIVDSQRQVVVCSDPHLNGAKLSNAHSATIERALSGSTSLQIPTRQPLTSPLFGSRSAESVPLMYFAAPIHNDDDQVTGVLGLMLDPAAELNGVFETGRLGVSGETYAFNRDGVMVSGSRFEEELMLLGILQEDQDATSLLNVQLRDPGQNTVTEGRPRMRLSEMPLTRMAESAIAGNSGICLDPYRDYRGVPVAGAWTWLPDLDLGLATEIDHAEAFAPVQMLHQAWWSLCGLLTAGVVGVPFIRGLTQRIRSRVQAADMEARELGQYRLESKLGAGAMGVVYRAYHEMMQRPTAVKLLNREKADETAIQRFEQEVQIVGQLNHPNTITIYDFGRTPEGVFYYAMEYLDGIDLQQLVEKYGPLPEGRVIHILKQVCGSLYEAHSRGLVHRDIKPSNIMVNIRGGEADFVKVLDFGLVKCINNEEKSILTAPDSINGTALYMSPEAIQSPSTIDARSDLYGVGAVGYFLLTGQPVFTGPTFAGILQQHVSALPLPPSLCLGKPVSEELESALMACLSKNPAGRPENARVLSDLLSHVPTAHAWTREEAERWWSRIQRGLSPRIPRIGRSVTCLFEQTMVDMTEEELKWKMEAAQDSLDPSVGVHTQYSPPWNAHEP